MGEQGIPQNRGLLRFESKRYRGGQQSAPRALLRDDNRDRLQPRRFYLSRRSSQGPLRGLGRSWRVLLCEAGTGGPGVLFGRFVRRRRANVAAFSRIE